MLFYVLSVWTRVWIHLTLLNFIIWCEGSIYHSVRNFHSFIFHGTMFARRELIQRWYMGCVSTEALDKNSMCKLDESFKVIKKKKCFVVSMRVSSNTRLYTGYHFPFSLFHHSKSDNASHNLCCKLRGAAFHHLMLEKIYEKKQDVLLQRRWSILVPSLPTMRTNWFIIWSYCWRRISEYC